MARRVELQELSRDHSQLLIKGAIKHSIMITHLISRMGFVPFSSRVSQLTPDRVTQQPSAARYGITSQKDLDVAHSRLARFGDGAGAVQVENPSRLMVGSDVPISKDRQSSERPRNPNGSVSGLPTIVPSFGQTMYPVRRSSWTPYLLR